MRLSLLLSLTLLTSCEPTMPKRSAASAGISGAGIMGTWQSTDTDCSSPPALNSGCLLKRASFSETALTISLITYNHVPMTSTNVHQIRFVSDSGYYDYSLEEHVEFNLRGNRLRVCDSLTCYDLRRP